jgi:hypothetical protein
LVISSVYKYGTKDGMSGSRHRKDGCPIDANQEKMMPKLDVHHKRMMARLDSQLEKMEAVVDVFDERLNKMDTTDSEAS